MTQQYWKELSVSTSDVNNNVFKKYTMDFSKWVIK